MTNERKIFLAGFAVLLVIIFYMFTRVERLEEEVARQSESFDASTQPQSLPMNNSNNGANAEALATQATWDLQRAIETQQRQDAERRYNDSVQATRTAYDEWSQQKYWEDRQNAQATEQAYGQRDSDRRWATQEAGRR